MPATAKYGFPYPPLTGVTPDIPRDLKALADGVEAKLGAEETARIAGDKALRLDCAVVDSDGSISIPSDYTYAPQYGNAVENTLGCTLSGRTVVVPSTGIYLLFANFQWLSGAGNGRVKTMIWLNPTSTAVPGAGVSAPAGGSPLRNATYPWSTGAQDVEATRVVKLNAGDKLMFAAYQDTGSAQKIFTATGANRSASSFITIDYLGAA